jgi:hypothetical protein
MPSLVAPLVSGIPAASSGTAEFYEEGTMVAASVYSDPHGVTAVVSHALDAYGAITRYIKDRVDVVVKTAGGATVKTFTWGTDAREVRVENLGYTGPNAVGAIVAGGRTTLHEVLSDFYTSLGAVDGRALIGGSATLLSAALASSSAVLYVVTAYGAVGNGIADDTTFIQAAINAASTAGGGLVVFPGGLTYKITGGVTVPAGVNLLALGSATITTASASATYLILSGSGLNVIENLTFTTTAVGLGGTVISVTGGAKVAVRNCTMPTGHQIVGVAASHASAEVTCIGCRFTIDTSNSKAGNATVTGARMSFIDCYVADSFSGASYAFEGATGTYIDVTNCKYVATATLGFVFGTGSFYGRINGGTFTFSLAAGTFAVCGGGAAQYVSLSGATFIQTAASSLIMVGSGNIAEAGCQFINGTGTVDWGNAFTSRRSQYRDSLVGTPVTGGWSVGVSPPAGTARIQQYTYTSGAPGTYTVGSPITDTAIGEDFTIILKNGTGAAVTVAWNAVWIVPTGYTSIAANTTWRMMFTRTAASEYTCVSSQTT